MEKKYEKGTTSVQQNSSRFSSTTANIQQQ